jgi:hypothetical protein
MSFDYEWPSVIGLILLAWLAGSVGLWLWRKRS